MKVFVALVLMANLDVSTSRDTDLLMIVDSLGAIVAEGVGVGQLGTQKCDCLNNWKQILKEDGKENGTKKHLEARVLKRV